MKKLKLFTVIIFLLLCVTPSLTAAGVPEDRWLYGSSGYLRAVELQRELNVPLVVYFYTDWCPYCHALDTQYLTAAPVQQYLRNVVKVRINPEHGFAERELAKQYGVRGYPSFFIMRSVSASKTNVNPFRRGRPNLTPAEFVGACQQAETFSAHTNNSRSSVKRSNPTASLASGSTRQKLKAQIVEVAPPSAAPVAPLPALDTVLAKYVTAVGGRDAQRRITSRVSRGKVDVPGVSFGGKLEVYAKAPNKSLTMMNVEPVGLVKEGYDGRTGWSLTPNGLELDHGTDRARWIDADFYWDTKLPELYARLKLVRKMKDSFRDVYLVEAVPKSGPAESLYFDVESGLLVRRDVTRKGPGGPVRVEVYFNDWREIDGVKLPFKVTQVMPTMRFVITFEEIKHNLPIDDAKFRP